MSPFDVLAVSALMELIPLTDSAGVVTASDWASVITAMTSQISVSTVVGVLATLVTAGIGLVFLWWGVRKAVGSLSLSARRAWIEIFCVKLLLQLMTMSLSARRAWIEIAIPVLLL